MKNSPTTVSFERTFLGLILALRPVYCAFFELSSREAMYRLSLIQDERRKHLLHLLAGKRDPKQLVFGENWYLKVASSTLFYELLLSYLAQNSCLFYFFFYNLDFASIRARVWLMREYFNFYELRRDKLCEFKVLFTAANSCYCESGEILYRCYNHSWRNNWTWNYILRYNLTFEIKSSHRG